MAERRGSREGSCEGSVEGELEKGQLYSRESPLAVYLECRGQNLGPVTTLVVDSHGGLDHHSEVFCCQAYDL